LGPLARQELGSELAKLFLRPGEAKPWELSRPAERRWRARGIRTRESRFPSAAWSS